MDNELEKLIDRALEEDLGDGDHTTLACVAPTDRNTAQLLIKEPGVIAGLQVAQRIFAKVDPQLSIEILKSDGDSVQAGDIAFRVSGSARSILSAERLVLNCMQRMSGIATYTASMCKLIEGTGVTLLDSRKTGPGMRVIEKMAVKIGGGENHRFGLYDMMMIKDNHIDFAGGVKNAIYRANQYLKDRNRNLKIEIEARSLTELEEILDIGMVDRIMLDNFNFDDLRTAVDRIGGKYESEASGGITEKTIRQYAECGVDYISVGALTHSVRSIDMSLKAIS